MSKIGFLLWFAMILTAAAFLPASSIWAYELTFKNKTKYEVKADVYEIRFIGAYKALGEKQIAPKSSQVFNTNGAYCLWSVKGWVKVPDHYKGFNFIPFEEYISKDTNGNGMPACYKHDISIVEKGDGKFKIEGGLVKWVP